MDKPNRMLDSFDDYTFLNRWGLTFLGIWKSETSRGWFTERLHRIHLMILFGLMTMLLIPQWLDMYELWGNFNAIAETIASNVFTITVMLKLMCFLAAQDIFEDVIATLKNNWSTIMSDEGAKRERHRKILLEAASKARYYTKSYCVLVFSTLAMYLLSPFVGMQGDDLRVRKYPFFGRYYFDRYSDLCYGICYACQIMTGIIVGTGNYAMDTIFVVAIYHSSAQLQILQEDLTKLGESGSHRSKDQIIWFIRKHQQQIRNTRNLEAIFRGSSLQQLLVSCIIICVIGFRLIIALNEGGAEFLMYMIFLLVVLLQIFLYCQPGDELIEQSAAVANAIYQSSWVMLDVPSIRDVSMIILRSQTPLQMTAGKIYVLSLPNFTMILKTSLSFLSLLRVMYAKTDY